MHVVGKGWWRCVYVNEFFLFLPVLTWSTIRLTFDQRVVDVLRTLPTVYGALVFSGALPPWTLLTVGVLLYWMATNLCMYRLDKQNAPKYVFSLGAQLLVAATLLSPSAFLTGSPAFWTGVGTSSLRYVCVAANLVASAYLAIHLLITIPYTDAWNCYPHPRNVRDLTHGYCPQAWTPPKPWSDTACKWVDNLDDNARCDYDRPIGPRSVHQEASAAVHVFMQILAISLSCYAIQVPRVIQEMRAGSCSKQD